MSDSSILEILENIDIDSITDEQADAIVSSGFVAKADMENVVFQVDAVTTHEVQ